MPDTQQPEDTEPPTPHNGIDVGLVDPNGVEAIEDTPGLFRQPMFRSEEAVVVQSRIGGGTSTGWHHHGTRHVFGYIIEGGPIVMEIAADGIDQLSGEAPGYFHVPPGVVHREINSTDEDVVVAACFVGSGPVVVNVDEPSPK